MVPVRFLVIGPFGVIEVSLSAWLKVVLLARTVFKGVLIKIHSLVNSILNIIGLSLNWVAQYFIGFDNQLEMVFTELFLFVRKCTLLEVGMMEFGHFVIREFYLLLACRSFDF